MGAVTTVCDLALTTQAWRLHNQPAGSNDPPPVNYSALSHTRPTGLQPATCSASVSSLCLFNGEVKADIVQRSVGVTAGGFTHGFLRISSWYLMN